MKHSINRRHFLRLGLAVAAAIARAAELAKEAAIWKKWCCV